MANPISMMLQSGATGGAMFNGKWKLLVAGQYYLQVPAIDASKSATPLVGVTSSFSDATSFHIEPDDTYQHVRIAVRTNNANVTYYLRLDSSGQYLEAAPFDASASWFSAQDATAMQFKLVTPSGGLARVSGQNPLYYCYSAIKYGSVANTTLGELGVGEVALFTDTNYGGSGKTGSVYIFSAPVENASSIDGLNDSVSSVMVGPSTAVALYQDTAWSNTHAVLSANQPQIGKTALANDTVSSFEPWVIPAPTRDLLSGEAVLYQLPNFNGLARLITGSTNLYCHDWQSLRVGPQTQLTLHSGFDQGGSGSLLTYADISDLAANNAHSPVRGCPLSIGVIDLNSYYSGVGTFDGYAQIYQYPNYGGTVQNCATNQTTLAQTIGSVRINPGYGITLYSEPGFQGAAFSVIETTSNVAAPFAVASMRSWSLLSAEANTYLNVDALLMQDYWQESVTAPLVAKNVYRLVIKPLQAVAGMRIAVAALDTISLCVGGVQYTLSEGSEHEFSLDQIGSLTLSIDANQRLTVSPLRIRSSNMPEDTYLVVFPDEQVHRSLAEVTADDLPAQISGDVARDAVASTLANLGKSMRHNYGGNVDSPYRNAPGRTTSVRLTAGGFNRRTVSTENLPSWGLDFSSGTAELQPMRSIQPQFVRAVVAQVAPNGGPVFTEQTTPSAWNQLLSNPASMKSITFCADTGSGTIRSQRSFLSDLWHKFVVVVETVADDVMTFVLDTIEAVGDFVMAILQKAGLLLDEAVQWLSALFNWDDILATHVWIKDTVNAGLTEVINGIGTMRTCFDALMESSIIEIDATFDRIIAQLTPAEGQTTLGEAAQPVAAVQQQMDQSSVQLRWGTTTFTDNAGGVQSTSPVATLPAALTAALDDMTTRVNQILDRPATREAFDNAVRDFKAIFEQPGSLQHVLDLGLAGLLEAIKGIANLALDVVKIVVDTLLTFAQSALAYVQEAMNQELTIPVLSSLYRSITTDSQGDNPNGSPLTVMDLTALLIAIPATVVTKLVQEGGMDLSGVGITRHTLQRSTVSPSALVIAMLTPAILIGPTDALGDQCEVDPKELEKPDGWPEFVICLLNIGSNSVQLIMEGMVSGRPIGDLLTFNMGDLGAGKQKTANFYQSLEWDYQWLYVFGDSIAFFVEASYLRYRLMRNSTIDSVVVANLPVGAAIHSAIALPLIVIHAIRAGSANEVVNEMQITDQQARAELLASIWLGFVGNIVNRIPDVSKVFFRIENLALRALYEVPATEEQAESEQALLNALSWVIDEGSRIFYSLCVPVSTVLGVDGSWRASRPPE